jgi:hypothetical protein
MGVQDGNLYAYAYCRLFGRLFIFRVAFALALKFVEEESFLLAHNNFGATVYILGFAFARYTRIHVQ